MLTNKNNDNYNKNNNDIDKNKCEEIQFEEFLGFNKNIFFNDVYNFILQISYELINQIEIKFNNKLLQQINKNKDNEDDLNDLFSENFDNFDKKKSNNEINLNNEHEVLKLKKDIKIGLDNFLNYFMKNLNKNITIFENKGKEIFKNIENIKEKIQVNSF
jgi:hypothetical protein